MNEWGLGWLRERYPRWAFWEADGRLYASRDGKVLDAASVGLLAVCVWHEQCESARRLARAERNR